MFKTLILMSAFLFADPGAVPPAPPESTDPTVGDYQQAVKSAQDRSGKMYDQEAWNKIELKHARTGEVKKFADFTPFEKDMFMLMQSERLSIELQILNNAWGLELKKLKAHPPVVEPPDVEPVEKPQRVAKEADVVKAQEELLKIRTAFAAEFEGFAEKVVKNHPTEIKEDEGKAYVDRIKEWHKKEKLTK